MEHSKGDLPHRNIQRVGVYGVARRGGAILLVTQNKGPYVNRFDLPGGGMEFGENIEEALHREFNEEVGMDFASMEPLVNLTAKVEVPRQENVSSYTFYQIGMIYTVNGLSKLDSHEKCELKYEWVEVSALQKEAVSPFVWMVIQPKNGNWRR